MLHLPVFAGHGLPRVQNGQGAKEAKGWMGLLGKWMVQSWFTSWVVWNHAVSNTFK
ncbi:hypothetical protein GCM10008938_01530 [Deinococcus roseus]|uniref:Transposase n=1 Tax=Deinococcus roseus TaxID=392414 RepID=A0ABQ2CTC1_9DEIO|nr:hypothetical protein GCM10008938_01530 [Deinococcus roseus]